MVNPDIYLSLLSCFFLFPENFLVASLPHPSSMTSPEQIKGVHVNHIRTVQRWGVLVPETFLLLLTNPHTFANRSIRHG